MYYFDCRNKSAPPLEKIRCPTISVYTCINLYRDDWMKVLSVILDWISQSFINFKKKDTHRMCFPLVEYCNLCAP